VSRWLYLRPMNGGNNLMGGAVMEAAKANEAFSMEAEGTRMGARLLILGGITIQLAMFGVSLLDHHVVWLAVGLMNGAWALSTLLWSFPAPSGLPEFWPLMLVVTGLAILWSTKQGAAEKVSTRRKENGDGE
jgi:hypothetical protein